MALVVGFIIASQPSAAIASASSATKTELEAAPWRRGSDLPRTEGVAGPFVGVAGDRLVLAGGANFIGGRLWSGGRKTWHDTIYTLAAPDARWEIAGHLSRPIGYGAGVSWEGGLLCLGGGDETKHYADVFRFRLRDADGRLVIEPQAPLPEPSAYHAAIVIGGWLYLAGGQDSPQSPRTRRELWRLDLRRHGAAWEHLEPWPGPGRMMAVLGGLGEALYLFGGYDLLSEASGGVRREFLRDAYRYLPAEGWKRCADLPRPVVGTPSPALPVDATHLVLLGWNDGTLGSIQPPEARPDFPADILIYEAGNDRWRIGGRLPFPGKVTPAVHWRDRFVVASGETQPSIRTPHVWSIASADVATLIAPAAPRQWPQ